MEGVSHVYVSSVREVMTVLRAGSRHRTINKTSMNEASSRSHTIFTIVLEQRYNDGTSKTSCLNLVDLAGSERLNRSGATGETLKEAQSINQSLSALGNCMLALTEGKRKHIP